MQTSTAILSSVFRNLDVAVFNALSHMAEGSFEGGRFLRMLENNGVGLAPFRDLDSMVPDLLKTEPERITEAIIRGVFRTSP